MTLAPRRVHARPVSLTALLLAAIGSTPLAQTPPASTTAPRWTVYGSLGARYGSALVRDLVVNPLTVAQDVGPALAIGVITPVERGWSGEAAVDLTLTGLTRQESGTTAALGDLRTLAVTAAVRRTIVPALSARVGAGALLYFPAERIGIFRSGTDRVTPVGILGLTVAPTWGARYGLAVDVRYDVHRFLTPALRSVGFTDGTVVHRVALSARAGFGASR